MESFLMAARVVLPMAMLMGLGVLLRQMKLAQPESMRTVDNLVFKVFIPCLSFYSVYNTDFSALRSPLPIAYGVAGLLILFGISVGLSFRLIRERPTAAAFGQVLVYPNFVIFGAAVAQSIYGEGNMGLVMLVGAVAVPGYSTLAAIVLELGRGGELSAKQLTLAVLRNPVVLATILGVCFNLLGVRIPGLVLGVVHDLGAIATPLGFLSIGVGLNFAAYARKKLVALGVLIRLVLIPAVFIPTAIMLGFRGPEMCGLMVLFGAPVAVSSYPAAVATGADGEFAGQMVACSTLGCLVTIFLWTLLLNALHLF